MTFSDDVDPAQRPPLLTELATVANQRVDQAMEIMIATITGNLYEEYGDNTVTEKTCRDAVLNAVWSSGV